MDPSTVVQCQHIELNVWGPPTLKQALARQCSSQYLQCPLGQTPLVTVYKDADIWHTSQLELLLLEDSIWSAHSSSNPPSSNTANYECSCRNSWEALCHQLTVTRLPNMEDHHHSHKPAWCSWNFVGFHQEFTWLSLAMPELISHKGFHIKRLLE